MVLNRFAAPWLEAMIGPGQRSPRPTGSDLCPDCRRTTHPGTRHPLFDHVGASQLAQGVAGCWSTCLERGGVIMSQAAELLNGIAAILWVVLGLVALLILRHVLVMPGTPLSKLGVGPAGVTMEFAEAKVAQAVRGSGESPQVVGSVAQRSVVGRMQRNQDLLAKARILWVDDHPENNEAIVDLLQEYGAIVEMPQTNSAALALLEGSHYDVLVSDVGRDDEGAGSDLKGVELAEEVYRRWRQPMVLFTARFDPTTLPDWSLEERLELTERLQKSVFGRTDRIDELLHYMMDCLER